MAAADDSETVVVSEPLEVSEPDGLIRLAPLSTRSLAVSATHAPAALADSTTFLVMDLAAGRRLPAFVAVGRRLATVEDDRADIFAGDDLAEEDLADVDLPDVIVRP
jgi:hypothetical protein